jgi:AbrB family looped-hinge helix DNA binding protein
MNWVSFWHSRYIRLLAEGSHTPVEGGRIAGPGKTCNNLTDGLTMSQTTKLSTKGQVVLPKSLRASHRWKPGTEFIIQDRDEGILLKPKSGGKARTWESIIGCVPYTGPSKSIKEMDEAVAAEARSRR